MKRKILLFIFLLTTILFAQTPLPKPPKKGKIPPKPLPEKKTLEVPQSPQPQFEEFKELTPKKTIDINRLRLGHSFPNILKGMYITVDETRGNVYLTGILTNDIYEVSCNTGKVLRSFDTALSGKHYVRLAVEPVSRTLFYITTDGEVISFDLKTGTKKGRYSYPGVKSGGKQEKLIFPEAMIDKNSNLLLLLCRDENSIYVFDDNLKLVKNIKFPDVPISFSWSDFYSSVVVSSGQQNSPVLKFSKLDVSTGAINEILSVRRVKPEKEFTIDENGNFYLLGQVLCCIDSTGKEMWNTRMTDIPEAMVCYNGKIALIFKDGHSGRNEGGKPSCVDFYGTKDGKYISTATVRFEAQNIALDRVHNRLCVGNGGDASVSVIDWNTRTLTATYRVASSSEEVIYNKATEDVYIMNRLGGSEIYRYNLKTEKFDTLIAGSWPVDMAFSPSRKKLYVMSHYEANIYVVDTEKFEVVDTISLGIVGSKSDTMSYMAFNDTSGVIAAGFPETADLVILNVDTKDSIKIKPEGATPLFDEGPGQWHIQISNDGKYILLYMDKQGVLVQYDTRGQEIASVPVSLKPKTYNQEIFRILPSTGQIYLGSYPISLNPLSAGEPNRFVHRVLDVKGDILYGNRLEKTGEETLVLVDTKKNKIIQAYKINKSRTIPSNCYFDTGEGRYFVTDMPDAKVYMFEIPVSLR